MDVNRLVFLLDVDNTLLDNDTIIADLKVHLERQIGSEHAAAYWSNFETLRTELGYADYLGALQQFRVQHPRVLEILNLSRFLIDYPFAERLFPRALDVVRHLSSRGCAVVLSDGDVVFQPHKIQRSGLSAAVSDRVLVYIHKEYELSNVEERFPARRYVMIDDKLRLLTSIKGVWQDRVTTVFVRQGHYAHEPRLFERYPRPDITVDSIAALFEHQF
jgi:FMN phosphatase YigB (HAD superfamily)